MIVMVGLDHRRASVEVRGRLSFSGDALRAALASLKDNMGIDEAAILSTCNRTEIYLAGPDPDVAAHVALRFIHATAARTPVPAGVLSEGDSPVEAALYSARGLEAVAHLYHVSAGLRSMVVGEAQILGQVRDTLAAAEESSAIGEELRAAFTGALQVGKRVRTDTSLSQADASIASLAVHVARKQLGTMAGKRVTLVGAGKTIELCARLLTQEGAEQLTIANRNVAAAEALATSVGARAIPLDRVEKCLADSHLLVSATAAPYPVISANQIGARASSVPLLVVDLAVPADVEPEVARLPGVTVISLDTLSEMAVNDLDAPNSGDPLTGRQSDIEDAERIITSALRDYIKAQTMRRAAPGITALRRHVDLSERQELDRALAQLPNLTEPERAILERFGARLVDKMFHHLVRRIRTLAEYDEIPPETSMQVLSRLFADTPDPESPHGQES